VIAHEDIQEDMVDDVIPDPRTISCSAHVRITSNPSGQSSSNTASAIASQGPGPFDIHRRDTHQAASSLTVTMQSVRRFLNTSPTYGSIPNEEKTCAQASPNKRFHSTFRRSNSS